MRKALPLFVRQIVASIAFACSPAPLPGEPAGFEDESAAPDGGAAGDDRFDAGDLITDASGALPPDYVDDDPDETPIEHPPEDAGVPGSPRPDAGTGQPARDAGTVRPPPDAGTRPPRPDAGTPRPDGGTPPHPRSPLELIREVAIPQLEASVGYRLVQGDNLARMAAVRSGLQRAVELLTLPAPDGPHTADLLHTPVLPVLESSAGYQRTLAQNPNRFGATHMGMARKAIADARAALGGSSAGVAAPTSANVRGALGILRNKVIPNLEGSSTWRATDGDNPQRMAIVRACLDLAIAILSFSPPDASRAADVLKSPTIPVLEASAAYQRVRAANPNAWASTKIGMARTGLDEAIAKLLPAPPPSTVWQKAGVLVWHAGAFPPGAFAQTLRQNGFGWVSLQAHDGLSTMSENDTNLASGWAQGYRAAGIAVGAWGVARTQPEPEAAFAADLVRQHGFDFYIVDAEAEYKYTAPDGSWSGEAYGRSQRFVAAFRARLPNLPAAISSYGRTDLADIDWGVFRDAGFAWLPQAYWNEFEIYQPSLCARAAVGNGWPLSRVHPTLGLWGGGQRRYVTADEYVADLHAAGTLGFSVYLGEAMPSGEWPVLGRAVAAGLAR